MFVDTEIPPQNKVVLHVVIVVVFYENRVSYIDFILDTGSVVIISQGYPFRQ